jgi:hypothetical protein
VKRKNKINTGLSLNRTVSNLNHKLRIRQIHGRQIKKERNKKEGDQSKKKAYSPYSPTRLTFVFKLPIILA